MKKTINIILIIFILGVSTLQAQEKPSREKLEALKVAFITEKIALSEKQAQEFWPLYNAFQKDKKALKKRGTNNSKPNFDEMSEDEIKVLINEKFERDENLLALEKTYFQKYQAVISLKQIIKLYQSERDFRKEVLNRLRERK